MRDIEHVVLTEDICPRIVAPALWDAVQPKLALNKTLNKGSTKDPTQSWFKGYVRCGHCGGKMRVNYNRVSGYHYRCQANASGVRRCNAPTISARLLDREVTHEIEAFFDNPLWLNSQTVHLEEAVQQAAHEIATRDQRITTLAKRKSQTLETVVQAPPALKQTFFEQLESIEAEITHHTQRRDEEVQRQRELTEKLRIARAVGDDVARRNYWPTAVGRGSFDDMDYAAWQKVFRLWQPLVAVWVRGHEPRWRLTFTAWVMESFDQRHIFTMVVDPDSQAEIEAMGIDPNTLAIEEDDDAVKEIARTWGDRETVETST